MNFTRRTYRKAIAQSQREELSLDTLRYALSDPMRIWETETKLIKRKQLTKRLQARKRRHRK